jgi:MFS family permease
MLDVRPLRSASFRHLAAASWVNEFGNWVGEIALAILVWDHTRSPIATAALFLALRFLPALLAPLLAVRLETGSARLALTLMYLVEAGLLAALAIVARHFSLPLLLALAGLDGVLSITTSALSRSALVTVLTRQSLLRAGNALLNFGGMLVIAGAPAVSGLLVASHGVVPALEVDVATFLVAALIIATSARGLPIASDREAPYRERLRAGLGTLRTRPTVRRLLVAIALVIALGSVAIPVEVMFAKDTLHAGDSGYGLLLTSWGVGMVGGAFAFATLKELALTTVLAVSTVLIAAGYLGLAVAPTLAIACGFSLLGGSGNSAAWVAASTALQERIPLKRQPALMALLAASNQLMPAIGFIVGGAVAALSSPRIAYAISGAGVAGILLAFTIWPIDRVQLAAVQHSGEQEIGQPEDGETQEPGALARNNYSPTAHFG